MSAASGTGGPRGPLPTRAGDAAAPALDVVWHDVECGSYDADLGLWRDLAREHRTGASAAVIEVGAGTGRVTIDLAREGHALTAVELSPRLLAELLRRADGLGVRGVCADARAFSLERRDHDLCLVPMQTVQLLGAADGRRLLLERARAHLRPGGLLCCALVEDVETFDVDAGDVPPEPESARLGGSLYLSRAVRVSADERSIWIERERRVLPAGGPGRRETIRLDRLTPSQLRSEGRASGFAPAGSLAIAQTEDHVGSTVVMLRA